MVDKLVKEVNEMIEEKLSKCDSICFNNSMKVLEAFKKVVTFDPEIFGSEIKEIVTLDGMRIVFEGGFALIRQSNTEPVFTLRFEARTKEECERYMSVMTTQLEKLANVNA